MAQPVGKREASGVPAGSEVYQLDRVRRVGSATITNRIGVFLPAELFESGRKLAIHTLPSKRKDKREQGKAKLVLSPK